MVQISWDDAVAFCKWASQTTGRKVQLPTEAQWEKAARGTDGRPYPWGMQALSTSFLNFNNNTKDTTPVGKYSSTGDSPYGAADMAGNAWEWTSSLIEDYPYSAADGREDMNSRKSRVLRGGSFYNDAKNVRTTYRLSLTPDYRYIASGFRVAVTPLGQTDIFGAVQTPTPAAGSDLQVFIAQSVHMDFARVPAGQFLMGSTDSDKDAEAYEKPQTKINLDAYLIGQYLVTNAQFAAFVDAQVTRRPPSKRAAAWPMTAKTGWTPRAPTGSIRAGRAPISAGKMITRWCRSAWTTRLLSASGPAR